MSAPRFGAATRHTLSPTPPTRDRTRSTRLPAWPRFPACLAPLALLWLALGSTAAGQEPAESLILALGEGLEAPGERRWTDEVRGMLDRAEHPHRLMDLRRPELSVRTLHEDFQLQVLPRDPDVVVIQVGCRDSRPRFDREGSPSDVPLDEFEWHLRDMIDELVRREVEVLLLTPTPRLAQGLAEWPEGLIDSDGLVASTSDFAERVRRLARNTGSELLDTYGFLKERHRKRPLEPMPADGDSPTTVPVQLPDKIGVELAQHITEKLLERGAPVRRRPGNPALDRVLWVAAGRISTGPFHWSGAPWTKREGFLEGGEATGSLHFDGCVERGDFEWSLRAVPTLGDGPGLSLSMDDSRITFERAGPGRLRLRMSGPLWRGIDDFTCAVPALDQPIEVLLRRRNRRELELWVAGEPVLRHFHNGRLDAWSVACGSGARLYSAELRGALTEWPAPRSASPELPQIDLASDTARQTIVDREPGQYLGHVSTLTLDDGDILAAYPKGHGRGAIVMKRSEDGGYNWSERLPLPENFATSAEVPTLWRCVDPKGERRIVLFSGLYPTRMARSEDEGATWTALEPAGHWGGIVAMGDVIPLKQRGHYLALFHDDGRFRYGGGGRGRFFVLASKSINGGLSWSEPHIIASLPQVDLCEPGFARSPDGEEIAVCLRENSRTRNSFLITSRDEGQSWSEPRELPADLTGDRHTLRYAPDGRLVITFRDTGRQSPTAGDWVLWVGTYDDLVNGRAGQYRARLMDNHHRWDCAYPGLELLPNGTFVATTYGYWTEGESPYIVSVHFNLNELDEAVENLPEERDK